MKKKRKQAIGVDLSFMILGDEMLLDAEFGVAARSRGSREQRVPGSSAAGVVTGSCCCFRLAPEMELLLQGLW
jgi:hypothetical protein